MSEQFNLSNLNDLSNLNGSQNLNNIFDEILIPTNKSISEIINLDTDITFEKIIGQLQIYSDKILCVINGKILRYFDKPINIAKLPRIRFDYKQQGSGLSEYYFRDIDDDTLYCLFGRENAKFFFPRLDEIDAISNNERLTNLIYQINNNNSIDKPSVHKHIINIMANSNDSTDPTEDSTIDSPEPDNKILIIDRGIKFQFLDNDYPVEIVRY